MMLDGSKCIKFKWFEIEVLDTEGSGFLLPLFFWSYLSHELLSTPDRLMLISGLALGKDRGMMRMKK